MSIEQIHIPGPVAHTTSAARLLHALETAGLVKLIRQWLERLIYGSDDDARWSSRTGSVTALDTTAVNAFVSHLWSQQQHWATALI